MQESVSGRTMIKKCSSYTNVAHVFNQIIASKKILKKHYFCTGLLLHKENKKGIYIFQPF